MDVPHRYDLEQNSCVNKEVEKCNRKIRKHMKVFENTEVIKVDLEGVSQNMVSIWMQKEKELMAKRIAAAIKLTLTYVKRHQSAWNGKKIQENQGLGEAKNWSWKRKRSNWKPEWQCLSRK